MKKSIQTLLCGLLCLITAAGVTACGEEVSQTTDKYSSTYSEREDGSKESSSENSSEKEEEEEEEDVPQTPLIPLPPADEPDPEKELLREETDALGHKIAYYTDGTWEDLGRVEPLDFTPRAAQVRFGYQRLALESNGEAYQKFYKKLYEEALVFSMSARNVAPEVEEVGGENIAYYPIAKVDAESFGLSADERVAVWKTLKQDCPEFYWLGTHALHLGDMFWLCIDGEYANAATRSEIDAKIREAALECDGYLNGKMSDTELALTINDYLATDVTYVYDTNGEPSSAVWAHNLTGWALYGGGVCETYAEAFAYLCDLFGLEAWTVSGVAAETGVMTGHAWNILHLDDVWYNVDVTWNDGLERSYSNIIERKWFGMAATEFAISHLADDSDAIDMSYQVQMPALFEGYFSPVSVCENGGEEVLENSLGDAFQKMTNAGGMYEVKLYARTNVLKERNAYVNPQSAVVDGNFPNVAGITLLASPLMVSESSYIPATLVSKNVTLNGNVTVAGFTWQAENLHLGNHTLSLGGDTTLSTVNPVTGGETACLRVDAGNDYAVVDGIVLANVEVVSGRLYVNKGATIGSLYLGAGVTFAYESAENLTINNVYRAASGATIWMTKTTAQTVVTIENIYKMNGQGDGALVLNVDFVGVTNYPQLKLTGASQDKVYIYVDGDVSAGNPNKLTPSNFTGVMLNISASVNQSNLLLCFVEVRLDGLTAVAKNYVRHANGDVYLS